MSSAKRPSGSSLNLDNARAPRAPSSHKRRTSGAQAAHKRRTSGAQAAHKRRTSGAQAAHKRRGVIALYSTLHRFAVAQLDFSRRHSVRVADTDTGSGQASLRVMMARNTRVLPCQASTPCSGPRCFHDRLLTIEDVKSQLSYALLVLDTHLKPKAVVSAPCVPGPRVVHVVHCNPYPAGPSGQTDGQIEAKGRWRFGVVLDEE
jgi:hypothetical protein